MENSIYDEETIPSRVGIIGYPVGHSLSPRMHTAAFRAVGLNLFEYLIFSVESQNLPDAIRGIHGLGFRGVNITIPYKQLIIPLLDVVTPQATIIGAVNTIVKQSGRLAGYNTDWIGFLAALKETGFDPRNCKAVLLGAGGAARAVLYALLEQGATITIANRNRRKAEEVVLDFSTHLDLDIPVVSLYDGEELQVALNDATLLINSTSVGMSPHSNADPLPSGIVIPPHLTVYDLVYNPRETQLLKRAREAGASGIDGLGMLVHQGAEAFRLWTGLDAPIEVMRKAIE